MIAIITNDIYPLETLQESSLYAFLSLMVLLSFFIFLFARFLVKKYKNDKNKELKFCINILKQRDSYSAKIKAYQISHYGNIIAKTIQEKELLKALNERLYIYKYQENPPKISLEITKLLQLFITQVESRYV